jgi:peptidyl-prolyl cis-trans isomerase B (cyclophilin B)
VKPFRPGLPLQPLLLALLLLLSPLGPVACKATPPAPEQGCGRSGVPCLKGTAVVELKTSKGEVQLTLNGDAAPLTAGNFVDLVRRGVYNGTVFHRVVREPTPFVVQGGDPQSIDPLIPIDRLGAGGYVNPATGQQRQIPLEIFLEGEAAPRYSQLAAGPSQLTRLKLPHKRGALAMARSEAPDSASAQFYIALQPLPELDGRYAVFGEVSRGMDVVDRIRQGDRVLSARVVSGGTLVQDRP